MDQQWNSMTVPAILGELGERVRKERLNQNQTRANLARKAGLSLTVIARLEAGLGCNLGNLVQILRALDKLNHLDTFLPDPGFSPVQLARLRGRVRQRASSPRGNHA